MQRYSTRKHNFQKIALLTFNILLLPSLLAHMFPCHHFLCLYSTIRQDNEHLSILKPNDKKTSAPGEANSTVSSDEAANSNSHDNTSSYTESIGAADSIYNDEDFIF